jgi:hypothetical protein
MVLSHGHAWSAEDNGVKRFMLHHLQRDEEENIYT